MTAKRWRFQEASNHLEQVIENALSLEPQVITRDGKDVVVVVAFSEWMKHFSGRKKLVEVLRGCPVPDFEIPRDGDTSRVVEM